MSIHRYCGSLIERDRVISELKTQGYKISNLHKYKDEWEIEFTVTGSSKAGLNTSLEGKLQVGDHTQAEPGGNNYTAEKLPVTHTKQTKLI